MARVTVEDCVEKVPNRFELVMMASQRAREISSGAQLTIERDNDKNPVVALREIADSTVEQDNLQDSLVASLQKHIEVDEPEEGDLSEAVVKTIDEEELIAQQEAKREEERANNPALAMRFEDDPEAHDD